MGPVGDFLECRKNLYGVSAELPCHPGSGADGGANGINHEAGWGKVTWLLVKAMVMPCIDTV